MTNHKPKLPALTRTEIEAVPDGAYETENRYIIKSNGIWHSAENWIEMESPPKPGDIIARLVDPKPLVELLREARDWIKPNAWDIRTAGMLGRIEAALEGNDG